MHAAKDHPLPLRQGPKIIGQRSNSGTTSISSQRTEEEAVDDLIGLSCLGVFQPAWRARHKFAVVESPARRRTGAAVLVRHGCRDLHIAYHRQGRCRATSRSQRRVSAKKEMRRAGLGRRGQIRRTSHDGGGRWDQYVGGAAGVPPYLRMFHRHEQRHARKHATRAASPTLAELPATLRR